MYVHKHLFCYFLLYRIQYCQLLCCWQTLYYCLLCLHELYSTSAMRRQDPQRWTSCGREAACVQTVRHKIVRTLKWQIYGPSTYYQKDRLIAQQIQMPFQHLVGGHAVNPGHELRGLALLSVWMESGAGLTSWPLISWAGTPSLRLVPMSMLISKGAATYD